MVIASHCRKCGLIFSVVAAPASEAFETAEAELINDSGRCPECRAVNFELICVAANDESGVNAWIVSGGRTGT